jgi:c-di-GMP-binding flagellar brake protein YcgR
MSGIERRRFVRVPFYASVKVTPSDGRAIEARSFDISVGGVGLIGTPAPGVGQVIQMEFSVVVRPGVVTVEAVLGRVMHVKDIGATALGVEFLDPLDDRTPALLGKVMAA